MGNKDFADVIKNVNQAGLKDDHKCLHENERGIG